MTSIFISYRRGDSGGHACRLFDRLRYWFPRDELFIDLDSIGWGDDFPEAIEHAIRQARVVLVVIGHDWLDEINRRVDTPGTDFVRRELSIALERRASDDVELLPILVGDSEYPALSALRPELQLEIGKLFEYQAYAFPMDIALWNTQFERLREHLGGLEGVPRPRLQNTESEGGRYLSFDHIGPSHRACNLNVEAVRQAFGTVSNTLLNWPQETEGQWIERPELSQLHELTNRHNSTVTALLGGPGEGKSAILARLGVLLSKEDAVLLALKADRIPRGASTLRDLDTWIGSEVPATQALRQLANDYRVVVLIDQLDALSDLMDQHSERLGSLIRLIDSVRETRNLHVIVSCRRFEFRNDVRISTLDAEKVSLQPLSWEKVKPLLSARGFETSGWSEDVRNVLRTPQHLAMFMAYLPNNVSAPTFTNYQGLLALVLEIRVQRVHGMQTVKAAETIATAMAAEEELWLGRSRFELEFGVELQRLEESGLLIRSENELSIAFRHQTLFDFLRARAFLRDQQSLVGFVVDLKQQSLFVRPILWSTLNYLRASDKAAYLRQFQQFRARTDLRPHIQSLIVSFLGQVPDPNDQEAQWLFALLDNPAMRSSVLRATAGSPGWFNRLQGRLPALMTADPDEAWEVTSVLRRAFSFDSATVLCAVDKNWLADSRYLSCAMNVMRDCDSWNASSVAIVCKLMDYAPADTFWARHIATRISKRTPQLAPTVVARYLTSQLDQLDSSSAPDDSRSASNASEIGELEQMRATRDLHAYERLIDDHNWRGIDKVARRAPREFVTELWPWLNRLFSHLAQEEHPLLHRYRNHNSLAFAGESTDRHPLQSAIQIAIREFACSHPEDYLAFVKNSRNTDLRVLHRLLSLGLKEIAHQHALPTLQYLLEDPRRFALGDMHNEHGDTQALISAVVPSLKPDDALRLEMRIREWTSYRGDPGHEDATSRFRRRKWTREHRLRLLRAFPFDRLSISGQRNLKQEERALPDVRNEDAHYSGGVVGSPMSSEQMENAADDDILTLFDELTDDTDWHHPSRRWTSEGGSVQASQEFARFAKKMPRRAFGLIPRFQAGRTERPVASALPELANGSISAEELVACIHGLDDRRFSSQEFRTGAARCLRTLAQGSGGLQDETCVLLEGWITDWTPDPDEESITRGLSSSNGFAEGNQSKTGEPRSVLWDHGSGHLVPHENYPILDALMYGYIMRDPPDVDEWLAILERHLARNENPKVWRALAGDMWRLFHADREKAIRFFESFFSLHADALRNSIGVSLIACVQPWIPSPLVNQVLDDWLSSGWPDGPQAAGEIHALRYCRNPDDPHFRMLVERILSDQDHGLEQTDELRLGLAFTFVQAWSEPALRALTTPLLIRLTMTASSAIDTAMSRVFLKADPLPVDDHTKELLEALVKRPSILAQGEYFLLKGLKGLLRGGWNPNLVYSVASVLITISKKDLGDIRTSTAAHAGELADIALTLHRIPESRELGLELFERLMDARSYGLDERIAAIDRVAFR